MSRLLSAAILTAALLCTGAASALAAPAGATGSGLRLTVPASATTDESVAVEFRLPGQVAAVDGRILIDTDRAEVVGVAPLGAGFAMAPQQIHGGAAFGAYGLRAVNGQTTIRIVLAPRVEGKLQFRIVLDSAADASGNRLSLSRSRALGALSVGQSRDQSASPIDVAKLMPLRAASRARDLFADGVIGKLDLDAVRAGWEQAHSTGNACAAVDPAADANSDGCVDAVDLQALVATQGHLAVNGLATDALAARGTSRFETANSANGHAAPTGHVGAAAGLSFTVTSTQNTADANNGDGLCADSLGRCTFRAAITESNWQTGDNAILFNISGTVPIVIQLTSSGVTMQDRTGGTFIDGYSQPGSHVNTATVGSNAVPGIELRGSNSNGAILRITSANNTVRGFVMNSGNHEVVMDGVDAHNNHIVGNLLGFDRNGNPESNRGHDNVFMENGANHNNIGEPTLADRNVNGRATKPIYMYGPGTDYNVIRNNFICMTPSGMGTASCSTGIDHDFGPKHNEEGGLNALERNVIGGTTLNGIEISHGWNPNGQDVNDTWHNNYNHVIGNWIGFRGDGSYDSNFQAGQSPPNSNDANGVNCYDGSNYNVIENNYIGARWDGVNTMSPTSTGNTIRNNVIGESPLGQAAPLGRYGIDVRTHTKTGFIEGNIIRNAAVYGIGLVQFDVMWFRLSQNIITDMSGPAIYLQPNPNNSSTGANNLTPSPVITAATTVHVSGTATPGATVEVYKASRNSGQSGLPIAYLGSAVVASNGSWSVPVTLQTGDRATALQILPSNNTSALGTNVTAVFEQPPASPTANFNWGQEAGSLTVDFNDTSSGEVATRTWDFGDGSPIATESSVNHTYGAPGDYSVKLTVGNAGGSDSRTRTVSVQAVAVVPYAADNFGRTVSGGWGTADVGGNYTLSGNAANFSVGNGVGSIVLPGANANRAGVLNSVSQADVEIVFRVRFDKLPTGANYFTYAIARANGTNEYRARLVLNSNGTVTVNASKLVSGSESPLGAPVVVSGLSQSANAWIWVRARVTGANPTTVSVRAWADGQTEPATWQFTATDSAATLQSAGAVGLRTFLASGVTNAPVTVSFDDYAVTPAN